MGIISLVFGIIALIWSVFGGGAIGITCGVLGIIFGAISAVQNKGKAGLILSIIALLWEIIITIACFACIGAGFGAGLGAAAADLF